MEPTLERLLQAVLESPKYRHVSVDLIRRLGAEELAKRRNLKEAVKETKNTLHQIAGAYWEQAPRLASRLAALETAPDSEQAQALCLSLMAEHASTRERLPFLADFYRITLAEIAPVTSVLDLACGLNPLAIPWMPLTPQAHYTAYDIYGDSMAFLDGQIRRFGLQGGAEARDVAADPPAQEADLALVLKFWPILEQMRKGAGIELLRALRARYLLVSFPTRSLGGRGKGMAENYEARFRESLQEERWRLQRFEFPAELCFLVEK